MARDETSSTDVDRALDGLAGQQGPAPADGPGVRTRFAPAPSGDLHVGNARTALFSWALARHHGGTFVLRVEDTDASRATEEGFRGALDVMRWLGLDADEGPDVGGPHTPYRQSERRALHDAAVERLVASGAAYRSYETSEELEEMRARRRADGRAPGYDAAYSPVDDAERARREAGGAPSVVRLALPDEGVEVVDDLVRGRVEFDWAHQTDPALTRAGGAPLYLLAAAVDDAVMGVTHVVRGEDLLSATPRQRVVMRALGVPEARLPRTAHLPLIVGDDGRPLSKRHGETSVTAYRASGYLPEALVNYLALLGFSLGDDREVFDVDELVTAFDVTRVSRNPARFDVKKLDAVAGEHVRRLHPEALEERLLPLLQHAGLVDVPPSPEQASTVRALAPLVQTRVVRLPDAVELCRPVLVDEADFVRDPEDVSAQLVADVVPTLGAAAEALERLEPFDATSVEAALRDALVDGLGLKPRVAFRPLYVAVTGRRVGAPLFDVVALLGRERAVARLRDAVTVTRDAGTRDG